MAIDLSEAKARIAALETEALASLSISADAVGYFVHQQERMPYWTNRTGDVQIGGDSEDFDVQTVTIIGRLYVAHITDGVVRGEVEQQLDQWLLAIAKYVNERELLQSQAYPDPCPSLIRCRTSGARGYTEFVSEGKIGTEYTFVLEFEEPIEQQYL